MYNFWQKLPKPLLILAPMEDVTDTVFRQIVARCARPDVFITEFTNVSGMLSAGNKMVSQRLKFSETERPIVAQIWGINPEHFYKASQMIAKMGFDGIDINMGCPIKKIIKNGSCAALIKNHKLTAEIIKATIAGGGRLPVSVKTRLGFDKIATEDWTGFLLDQNLDSISIHARTAIQMSSGEANWDEIGKAVKLRNKKKSKTLIIGNGDVKSYQEALEKVKLYGVDGVMIGRGIFENLWVFDRSQKLSNKSFKDMLGLLLIHIELFEKTWGNTKNFSILKKYFKIYLHGFPNSKELREKLMVTTNISEVKSVIKN